MIIQIIKGEQMCVRHSPDGDLLAYRSDSIGHHCIDSDVSVSIIGNNVHQTNSIVLY